VATYHVAAQLDALGDPTRRAILERLLEGPLPVVEIARMLPITRPAVSQHLKVLADVGLVTNRAEGTRRLYALDPAGMASIREYFERFWDEALDEFRRVAEESYTGSRHSTKAKATRREKRR
jgi:DNA-binding transcriptional ArsR family regulator